MQRQTAHFLSRTLSTYSRTYSRRSGHPLSLVNLKSRIQPRDMSSDADYESFLNKANQDTAPAPSKSSSKSKFTTKAVDTEVPAALKSVQVDYVSEVDEPFEPVSLKWTKKTRPSETEFKSLLSHNDTVEELQVDDFDGKGQYKEVIKAVTDSASAKDVFIYRVMHGATRSEYYVVAVNSKEGKLVGMKAKAVES